MSRKLKYGYEQRLQAVFEVIKNYKTFQSVATEIGADKKEIRRWVAMYEEFGSDGLLIKNRHYSVEFKLSVIKYMRENSLSFFKAAIKFGIPDDSSVREWARIYNEYGAVGFMQKNRCRNKDMNSDKESKLNEKTKEELLKDLEYLQAENAYLKKLQALVQERIALENGRRQKPSKN